jgi:hypothetical protein
MLSLISEYGVSGNFFFITCIGYPRIFFIHFITPLRPFYHYLTYYGHRGGERRHVYSVSSHRRRDTTSPTPSSVTSDERRTSLSPCTQRRGPPSSDASGLKRGVHAMVPGSDAAHWRSLSIRGRLLLRAIDYVAHTEKTVYPCVYFNTPSLHVTGPRAINESGVVVTRLPPSIVS